MTKDIQPQMDDMEAAEAKAEIVRRMENWHGDTIALGKLLYEFDYRGGWQVLAMEDDAPKYKSMWDFFRGTAPKWNLSANYFYQLRDQGRAQEQSGVIGWSGSSLKQLAKLNDDPKKQLQIVEDIKRDMVEVRGEMQERGPRAPIAKEVRDHVKWALPKKEEKDKVFSLPKLERTGTNLKITAVMTMLSQTIDQMNSTALDIDEHAARKALNSAQAMVEKAYKLLFPFKEIVNEAFASVQE